VIRVPGVLGIACWPICSRTIRDQIEAVQVLGVFPIQRLMAPRVPGVFGVLTDRSVSGSLVSGSTPYGFSESS
jgi:ABC-type transporter Mla maintaining outer membrane lipid asymmetry permease subunit MlaE